MSSFVRSLCRSELVLLKCLSRRVRSSWSVLQDSPLPPKCGGHGLEPSVNLVSRLGVFRLLHCNCHTLVADPTPRIGNVAATRGICSSWHSIVSSTRTLLVPKPSKLKVKFNKNRSAQGTDISKTRPSELCLRLNTRASLEENKQ